MKKVILTLSLGFNTKCKLDVKDVDINVFVHGTVGSKMFALHPGREYPEKLKNKHKKYRQEEFPKKGQILPELGMHKIVFEDDFKKNSASEQIIKIFDQINKQEAKHKKKKNLYYAFGWSGSLDKNQRHDDSKKFLLAMLDLYFNTKQKNPKSKIKITLIGISHGVNLIMSAIETAEQNQLFFPEIKNFISIAGPVVEETIKNASNPYTKNFIHLYSKGDFIQNLDNKSTDLFSSKRSLKNYIKPQNTKIYQAKLSIGEQEQTYLPTHTDMVSISNLKTESFISKKEKALFTAFYKILNSASKNKVVTAITRRFSPTKKKTIQEYLSEIIFKILSNLDSKKIVEKKKMNLINPIPLVCFSKVIAKNLKKQKALNKRVQIIINENENQHLTIKIAKNLNNSHHDLIYEFRQMKNEMSNWLDLNNKTFYKNKFSAKKQILKIIDLVSSHIELFWDDVGPILKNISAEMSCHTRKPGN